MRAHNHRHGKYLTLSDKADTLFSMDLIKKPPPEGSLAYMAYRVNGPAQIAYTTTLLLRVAAILRAVAAAGGFP